MLDKLVRNGDNLSMRKLFLMLFVFLIGFSPTLTIFSTSAETPAEYICVANYCYLYSSPSFTSSKVQVDGADVRAMHKDIVNLELINSEPVEYPDSEGMIFYKVESFQNNAFDSAYIFSDYVTKNTSSIETYPAFNASINTATDLMEINGETLTPISVLEKGVRVYLYEGFNGALTYTPVAVRIDNTLQYGYVFTDHITPDGINPFIIYASIIAVACIGIVIALLFMKNKKWHK